MAREVRSHLDILGGGTTRTSRVWPTRCTRAMACQARTPVHETERRAALTPKLPSKHMDLRFNSLQNPSLRETLHLNISMAPACRSAGSSPNRKASRCRPATLQAGHQPPAHPACCRFRPKPPALEDLGYGPKTCPKWRLGKAAMSKGAILAPRLKLPWHHVQNGTLDLNPSKPSS